MLWGVALLVIYSRAVYISSHTFTGCVDTTIPWLSAKYPCSIFMFNCYRHQVASPDGSELDQLDPGTLSFLIYSHCSALQVPSAIQNFPFLMGFHLHNSTLQYWTSENAFSTASHPNLLATMITRVNMSEFPPALLELPASVSDISFSETNLTRLPDDLNERWHPLSILFIEFSELKELPKTIFEIPVMLFSFYGNEIESLPSLDDARSVYYVMDFGGNPLRELPVTIGNGTSVAFLNIENSNLLFIPSWVYTNVILPFGLGDPYCQSLGESTSAVSQGCLMPYPHRNDHIPIKLIDNNLKL